MSNVPAALKYTKEHEWVKVDGGTATVGITDHAQAQLGDIVFVDLPKVGGDVAFMKPLGVIESVKAASDVFSPLTGTVTAINEALKQTPELINKDCYGAGWLVKIAVSKPDELAGLLDAGKYETLAQQG